MNESNTLGQRIQAGRKAAGMSQEALGEQLGVSRQAVSKWEADAAIPELENLIAMSRMFGVSLGVLLGVEKAEEAPTLSEQELQAAQAIAEKYAEQIKPNFRPRWLLGAGAAVLVCAVIIGMVQYRANHRIADLNEQLVTLQMQMNDIQNGVAGQLSGFASEMQNVLEAQSKVVFNADVKITGFSLEKQTLTLTVTATAKEWDETTTGQFTATLDDGSVYTVDAVCNNGVFTAENWELPRDADGGFSAQFSITLRDNDTPARTSPVDSMYAYPEDFRLNLSGTTEVSTKDNTVTLYRVNLDYYEGGYAYVLNNPLTAVDFCVYRNSATLPETVIPLTSFVETVNNNPWISAYSNDYVLRENGLPVDLEEGDTVLFVLRSKDSCGNVFYYVMVGLKRDEYGLLNLHPWGQDEVLMRWTPGDMSDLKFSRG